MHTLKMAAAKLSAAYLVVFLSFQILHAYVLRDDIDDATKYNWVLDDEDNELNIIPDDLRIDSEIIQMPNVKPETDDMYICASTAIPEKPSYIVGIQPVINTKSVDDVWLIGCAKAPAKSEPAWSCSPDARASVCDGPALVAYKWSRDNCPNYVSESEILTVGGQNLMRYMVLMVHYKQGGVIDSSGLRLKMVEDTLPQDKLLMMMEYFGISITTNSCDYDVDEGGDSENWPEELSVSDAPTEYPEETEQVRQEVIRQATRLKEVQGWLDDELLGQVSGVGTDSVGNLHVFHRASRKWAADSFDENHVFKGEDPIEKNVVFEYDKSGKFIKQWGERMFYMPHGLTVDYEDNIWLTDVAMHQVFKFPPGSTTPSISLGIYLEHGSDDDHFCKPTDVAVDSRNGDFYISDGYCNSRVLRYNVNGTLINTLYGTSPGFNIPHSLTLVDTNDGKLICVADRENKRVRCFDTDSSNTFKFEVVLQERVCAIEYESVQDVIYAVTCPQDQRSPSGVTIDIKTKNVIDTWAPSEGFTFPHDVTSYRESSSDPVAVYVGEISGEKGKGKVTKFTGN